MKTADSSKKGFAAQMKVFFGLRPGQALADFAEELKALADEDKEEFAVMLTVAGYPCDAPNRQVVPAI